MKLAVVVPYRDRHEHLIRFLPAIHHHLEAVDHQVVVVEQARGKPFNRGMLLNIGCELMDPDRTHLVLHDVDMLPEEVEYAPVTCPTHLAGAASQFRYALPYSTYFGGVTLFPVADFRRINGFSNGYWGWGAEDDDLLDRCKHHGLQVDRVPGRFRSLAHVQAVQRPEHATLHARNGLKLVRSRKHPEEYATDGLSDLQYELHHSTNPWSDERDVQHLVGI